MNTILLSDIEYKKFFFSKRVLRDWRVMKEKIKTHCAGSYLLANIKEGRIEDVHNWTMTFPYLYKNFIQPNKITLRLSSLYGIEYADIINGELDMDTSTAYPSIALLILILEHRSPRIDYTEFDKHCNKLKELK
jgi:hypothetical protein